MSAVQNSYDVIVIGSGPAGSAASAVLAQKGRRVIALERENFPRYHIGESLIPYSYFPLQRLGMIEKMKASAFTKKYSVQFVTPDGQQSIPFYFFKHLEHEASCTWQVVRGDFDKMLMENARERGAEIREETRATELLQDGDSVVGVKAVGKDGEEFEIQAPITIDATGRDAFAMMRNKWRVRDPQLNKIAIWTYYKGAKRDPGIDEGATTVAYVPEKGWFWYIPLPGDIVSVGIVAEKDYLYNGSRDLAEIYRREVKNNAWIEEHLAQGMQIGEYRVTGEYSYRSKYCAADGLVLIGDAFAFLDPVFSSGVFLALRSGELAADAVDAALDAQDYSAGRFTGYGDEMRKGIEAMRRLVYTFYDHNFSFGAFLKQHPNFRGEITDCLIGNSHLNYDPMFEAIGNFAAVPPPLEHGRPLLAHAS